MKDTLLSKKIEHKKYSKLPEEIGYQFIGAEVGDIELRLNTAFDILFDEMERSQNMDKL